MVEFIATISDAGLVYLPKPVREAFKGRKVRIFPNASAAVISSQATCYEHVLSSLEIISADLRHRIEIEKEKERDWNAER